MNIYLTTEGVCEKQVYSYWVPLINSDLNHVQYYSDISIDSLYIVSGNGYPAYFQLIEDAVEDVSSNPNIDRLVITIDSEDDTRETKYDEINKYVTNLGKPLDYVIVVQHFCFETWALGNKKIVRRNTTDAVIRSYRSLFDVLHNDPELLEGNEEEGLNRSQFAEKYLRCLLNDKFRNLTYSKSNPKVLMNEKYFESVKDRYQNDGHIDSFGQLITAFR